MTSPLKDALGVLEETCRAHDPVRDMVTCSECDWPPGGHAPTCEFTSLSRLLDAAERVERADRMHGLAVEPEMQEAMDALRAALNGEET